MLSLALCIVSLPRGFRSYSRMTANRNLRLSRFADGKLMKTETSLEGRLYQLLRLIELA